MDWIGAKRRRANDARPPQRQTSLLSTLGAVGYLRTQLRFGLPILLACFVAQALYMAERAWQTPVTALWIPGPLLLGWLLIAPVRIWPTCLLGAGCGMAAATLLFAGPYGMAMLSITVDCTLTVACAWAMLRSARNPTENFRELGRFILLTCVLLPLVRASWLVAFPGCRATEYFPDDFWSIAIRTSVSYLLVVPASISIIEAVLHAERRRGWHLHNFLVAAFLISILWFVWDYVWDTDLLAPLLVLAPIPFVIWALIAFGSLGATVSLLAVFLLGMHMGLFGTGPFATLSVPQTLLASQIWTLGTGIALLFLAALAEQNLSSRLSLQAAYRKLSELTGRMLVVQEEERTRIARDLHDDINQSLAAISIRLSALKRDIAADGRAPIADIQDQLLCVSNDIRNISHELHPSILRFTGLTSALNAFCEKHNTKGDLNLHCRIEDIQTLSDEQELGLFRIVQEALNNVDKHAGASNAEITLAIVGAEIVLRVDDDGV
ncbi:MAG: histidine kinase, partial [Pseudoxanthomonas sp.]